MPVDREIQVAIVGAGLGGLCLAHAFRRAGVDPIVVEAADSFEKRGIVVELWPDAVALLDRLGVADVVRDAGTVLTRWTRRRPDGTVATRLETDGSGGLLAAPYDRVRRRLVDRLGSGAVRMGTALRSLDVTEPPVTATFENGVTEEFDLVVGADGAHSRTRALVDGVSPVECGTTTWTFPIPETAAPPGVSEIWMPETVFRMLPVDGRPTGALTVPSGSARGDTDRVAARNAGGDIDWLLPNALEEGPPETVRRIEDVRHPSNLWATGRVALVGAAAHARHPLAGLAPTLAVEDGAVLVAELVDRHDDLEARLDDYAARRRERVRRLRGRPDSGPAVDGAGSSFAGPLSTVLEQRDTRLHAAFESGALRPAVASLPYLD